MAGLGGFPDDAGDEHEHCEECHEVHDGTAGQAFGSLLEEKAVDGETDGSAEHQDVTGCEVHAQDLIDVTLTDEIEGAEQGDDTASPCIEGLFLSHSGGDDDDEDRGGDGNKRKVDGGSGLCREVAERRVCGDTEQAEAMICGRKVLAMGHSFFTLGSMKVLRMISAMPQRVAPSVMGEISPTARRAIMNAPAQRTVASSA